MKIGAIKYERNSGIYASFITRSLLDFMITDVETENDVSYNSMWAVSIGETTFGLPLSWTGYAAGNISKFKKV